MEKKYKLYSALIILAFLPIFALAFFAHPVADDYDYSVVYNHTFIEQGQALLLPIGALRTTKYFWNVWQGLYSSAILMSLQPAILGEKLYFLGAIIIIGCVYLGIYSLYSVVLTTYCKQNKSSVIFPALLTCFYLFNAIPSPVQGIYWFNGAVNYMFFFGIFLFLLANILKLVNTPQNSTLVKLCILAIVLSGGNHITAFSGVLVLFFLAIYSLIKNQKRNIFPFVLGTVGFLFNLFSPGSLVRMNALGEMDRSILRTIKTCGLYSIQYTKSAFSFDFLILLILLLPCIISALKSVPSDYFKIRTFIFLLLLDYCITSAMFCVPHYAMGWFGEPRIYNLLFSTYVILGIITFSYGIGITQKYIKDSLPLKKCTNMIVRFSCFLCLFSVLTFIGGMEHQNGTTVRALKEMLLDKSAIKYDQEMNARVAYAKEHKGEAIELEPIQNTPPLIYLCDLSSNEDFYANVSFAQYYHLKSAIVKNGEWMD